MQPIIVMGDKTSHGGTVITCSQTSDTHGKGWARVGDKVACPRCKGVFPIAEGDTTLTDDGLAVAYHGCKVACGATLIAGQQFTLTDPAKSGGQNGSSSASDSLPAGVGAIGAGLAASYHEEQMNDTGERFRGRFQVIDATTGEPVRGRAARIRSTAGQNFTGTTDAEGFTQWVERDAAEALAFHLTGEQPG